MNVEEDFVKDGNLYLSRTQYSVIHFTIKKIYGIMQINQIIWSRLITA